MSAGDAPPPLPGGLGVLRDAHRLSGGSICHVWAGTLADGTAVAVKRAPYQVDVEVDGLAALDDAGAPVPEVLGADEDVLVLRHVAGDPDWHGLGDRLAQVHQAGGSQRFGWHRDNLLGRAVQPGGWSDDWPAFFAEHRIRPLLSARALPDRVRRRVERALDGPLHDLLGAHEPRPSLIHGDLWSGNIIDGRWLIDPAVWLADRELELAFTRLFGGVPDAFFAGYDRRWPLPDGAAQRRPALQLYHVLIHVWHFGSGYVGMLVDRLDELDWHEATGERGAPMSSQDHSAEEAEARAQDSDGAGDGVAANDGTGPEHKAQGEAQEPEGRRKAEDRGARPDPTIVDVYVEIPKGSRNKYEWDVETGRFRLDRKLFTAVQYPGDYGFVAEAWGEDGDPLDALVILGDPTFPGCVISARVVGVFYMTDDKGRDTKIITVPSKDPAWEFIDELSDVPEHLLDEIEHFFSIYKDLEQKKVKVNGFGSREDALEELERDFERYRNLEDPQPVMPWTPYVQGGPV